MCIPANSITDYLARVVKPKLDSLPGVQTAEILGGRQFALRAWLDPAQLAAHGVTAADVYQALSTNNYLAAVGTTKGQMVSVDLTAATDLHSVDEFRQLVIKQKDGAIVRLQDVANVVLGAENYDFNVSFSGKLAVFIGIKVAPESNLLEVAQRVRAALPDIQSQLPNGLSGEIVYDSTGFVTASIHEVVKTLVEALLIVTVVIFLFLGSIRAVIIPVIAMPLSLIGTFFVMLALGYSMNLLTLLALVLAIGLVVDDAIIVVENVDRHLKEEGKSPLAASLQAARELGGPIMAMTVVLVAVYVPIGFQKGLTGALFTEFAFTLAGAVTVSAVIALTLSPMMCSRFFSSEQESGRFVQFIDRQFNRVRNGYQRLLRGLLSTWSVVVVMGVLLFGATVLLGMTSKSELAPEEDQGFVFYQLNGLAGCHLTADARLLAADVRDRADAARVRDAVPGHQPRGQPGLRRHAVQALERAHAHRASSCSWCCRRSGDRSPARQIFVFRSRRCPARRACRCRSSSTPPSRSRTSTRSRRRCCDKARDSGKFWFIDTDLKIDKPQSTVIVDRDMVCDPRAHAAGCRQRPGAMPSAAATSTTSRSPAAPTR